MYQDIQLNQIFRKIFIENPEVKLFSDYGGCSYTYGNAAKLMLQMHAYFDLCGIKSGDKVALIGGNTAHWGISFLATMSYGATLVPILPEFPAADVMHIIEHSDAKLVLAGEAQLSKLNPSEAPQVEAIMNISKLETAWAKTDAAMNFWKAGSGANSKFTLDTLFNTPFANEAVGIISYTSGTSGFSKGVLLPYRAIKSNVVFACEHMPLVPGDNILSFLPMAHVFGMIFDFLFPIALGCHITFLSKLPTPKVLVEAFAEVKPRLILSVPLVIEKIYFKQVKPALDKPLMKLLLKTPLKSLIHKKLHAKLSAVFGGNFLELVVGGAAINSEVENFFRSIKFPFVVGYGMTECAPLITYTGWRNTKEKSAGQLIDRLEMRIDSTDPQNQPGEILIKGDNVMLGYYKNPDATAESFTADGWLRTGDLGVVDADGFLFIKGRSKNMLLSGTGQNIYPEEIEPRFTSEEFIAECVLVQRDHKLVALVYPDFDMLRLHKVSEDKISEELDTCRKRINDHLAKYSQVAALEIRSEEFEKTPKKSIKRYLYS